MSSEETINYPPSKVQEMGEILLYDPHLHIQAPANLRGATGRRRKGEQGTPACRMRCGLGWGHGEG